MKDIIFFTDIGRDFDDEVALIIAAGLLKLELINIKGIIGTLQPAIKRVQLAKGVMDSLGFPSIPYAIGSDVDKTYQVLPYEFSAEYSSRDAAYPDAQTLLRNIFESSEDHSLTLLLISGHTDAALFIETHPYLAQKIAKIVIMGGIETIKNQSDIIEPKITDGYLLPDESYNNKVDMPSANKLFRKAQEHSIPMVVVSRHCAMACSISPEFYHQLAAMNDMIGKRLCEAQSDAINHLWKRVFLLSEDPGREGLPPRCNQEWFLKTFTNNSETYRTLTKDDNIWSYVTKLNAYDPIALLAAVFPELFLPRKIFIGASYHHIVGLSEYEAGVTEPEAIRTKLAQLAKQALSDDSLVKDSNLQPAYSPRC